MKIPFLNLSPTNSNIGTELQRAFQEVLESNWYIQGAKLEAFEQEYAVFNKTTYCIGTSNGLDALHLALKALNIGRGDEVILPSNTYIATALAVSYVGATPIFVEPDSRTYNINPNEIENAISSRTKCIMPVHLYGQACQMDLISDIAKNYGLYIVEDNAQSQGASFKGRLTGGWGKVNGTSFYPGKNLGALGDAGAITTDDPDIDKFLRTMRNYGSTVKYHNEIIGFNKRLDELQAAFLSVKLKFLPKWIRERQQIASWYHEALHEIGDLILPYTLQGATHTYHLFVIRTNNRSKLQEHLEKNGIGTLIHYPIPPHLQEAYKDLGYKKGDFPIAEQLADTCLSLPIYPGLTQNDIEIIAKFIKSFFDKDKN
ncbi:MAG: DegT/DnrJ/EryC1/StrS family aminotransferase [Flavobacteriales bacterium]|nr:DegT/DnrJ/EryC1/StrS family aminotransferase [Flavobacteriales bacterium]